MHIMTKSKLHHQYSYKIQRLVNITLLSEMSNYIDLQKPETQA